MPKIICTLPNASTEISGVKFTVTKDQSALVSEEISQEEASLFLSIPGYELVEEETRQKPPTKNAAKAPEIKKTEEPVVATDGGVATGEDNVF